MKKRVISGLLTTALLCSTAAVYASDFSWADEAVAYCMNSKIIQGNEKGELELGNNLTREQMAKMLVESFNLENENILTFEDIDEERWSYKYISIFEQYMKVKDEKFNPTKYVTREEFASSLVLASGLTERNIRNRDILDVNFDDAKDISSDYKTLMCIAVERGYMKGYEQQLRANDLLTRAEVCTLLQRVLLSKEGKLELDLGVRESSTPMIGEPVATVKQARQWAKDNNATQNFIDGAEIYWKYGEITGVRPDILYAQAAKETGYGKYGGAVLPEQNNWAGIKTATATGDKMEDHETFLTPDDGVRSHFNHVGAYIGAEPVGEPHGRYLVVSKIKWAGTVRTLEGLGGKWCPDLYYGYSIIYNYLDKMIDTVPKPELPETSLGDGNKFE